MTTYILKRKRPPVLQYTGDYTKVGSPTIVDNVVSGFSSSNYLQLPKTFNGNVGNTWEMVWKFRLNSDYTSVKDHGILAYSSNVAYSSAVGVVGTKKIAYVNLATNTSGSHLVKLDTTTTLEPETDYWLKTEFTGTAYNLYLSTNGTDYNLEASVASTSKWTSYTLSNIGLRKDNVGTYPLKGSIDLTESYIKVDGEYWWRGAYYANDDRLYVFKRKRPKEYRKKVIDTATAGTYTFDVAKDTTARIILVGGGGGGGNVWVNVSEGGGGGSGACVYCIAKLKAGTYTITNGRGGGENGNGVDSTLSLNDTTLITAGGGSHGLGGNYNGGYGGAGGTYTIADDVEIEKNIIVSNGNTGGTGYNMVGASGGASVYKGYGKGGGGSSGTGTTGYIFVELTTDETDYDYKIDNDACYVLKRKQYWKYEYQDWTQPVLTSNTSYGEVSASTTATGEDAYHALDGVKSGTTDYTWWGQTTSNGWWKWELPTKLKIKGITFYNRYAVNTSVNALTGQFFTDETLLTPIGNTFTTTTTNWDVTEISGIPSDGVVTDCIYFNITNSASSSGIGELIITAQEQITVKGSVDDYDFTTD